MCLGFVCFQVKRELQRDKEENDGGDGVFPTLPKKLKRKKS